MRSNFGDFIAVCVSGQIFSTGLPVFQRFFFILSAFETSSLILVFLGKLSAVSFRVGGE